MTGQPESDKPDDKHNSEQGSNMAKHEHGTMDTSTQEATFGAFIKIVVWATVLILLFLVFLAMVNG